MKRVKVRGHYRYQITEYKVVVDPDNPANETLIPIKRKKIWVEPYTKLVK